MNEDLARAFGSQRFAESAQRRFTDRVSELEAYEASLRWYAQELAALQRKAWSVQDLDRARHHVLTYFGVGGIGKSSLVKALHDRTVGGSGEPDHWGPAPEAPMPLSGVHFDLVSVGQPSVESLLLAIRASLADDGVTCTAFDLLLARYWQEVHPGESISEHLRKESRLRRWSATLGLPEHLETAMGDAAAQLGGISSIGSSVTRVAKVAAGAVSTNRRTKAALERCGMLRTLLDAPIDADALAYYPHALAWDLAEAQQVRPLGLVIFLDTFEEARGTFADRLQRLIWLMPNVLFVVAGRNRISWAESSFAPPVGTRQGPSSWPGLSAEAPGDPRQHLIGLLSDVDARSYLLGALGGRPEISAEVIEAIVSTARGLPIHLDLAVTQASGLAAHGAPVRVADLELPFDALAARTLQDLSPDQRRAALSACLFDAFDVELVRATADLPVSGAVIELLDRSLIVARPHLPMPVAMHEVLRDALLRAKDLGDDTWSLDDFRRAGRRALAELARRWPSDRDGRPFLLQQALRIARTLDLPDPWLAEAAISLTSRSVWSTDWRAPVIEGLRGPDAKATWLDSLADGLEIVMGRQARPRVEVANGLGGVLALNDGHHELDVLRYFAAEAKRDIGDLDAAADLLDRLRRTGSLLVDRALHAQIHILRRQGRFESVVELLESDARLLPAASRLWGDLLWTQAKFDEAATSYRQAAAVASQREDPGEAIMCQVFEAYATAFVQPEAATALLDRASRERITPYLSFTAQLAKVVRLLADEGSGNSDKQETEVITQAVSAGHTSIAAYASLAALIGALKDGDGSAPRRLIRLRARARDGSMDYLVDIGEALVHGEATAGSRAEWTDGALQRWSTLVGPRER